MGTFPVLISIGLDQQTGNSRNPQARNLMNSLPNIGSTQSPTKYEYCNWFQEDLIRHETVQCTHVGKGEGQTATL